MQSHVHNSFIRPNEKRMSAAERMPVILRPKSVTVGTMSVMD